MATEKYKTESPFVRQSERSHHKSDFLYDRFTKSFAPAERKKFPDGIGPVINIALFGIGRAGGIHLNNILGNPRIELSYLIDADEERWNLVSSALPLKGIKFCKPEDAAMVFADKNVDGVIIATPTYTHTELIKSALKAGKAVFSEKPIAENVQDTIECYDVAEKVKQPLLCAFNRRFDPTFGNVYQRVREGEVGHVQQIKMISRDSPLPGLAYLKISGGIYHDCAVHDIDLMTWILGEYPSEVYSCANAQIPDIKEIDDFDNLVCTLRFPSGTIGIIEISRFASYGYDQRCEVFGPKGMLVVNNNSPNGTISHDNLGISRSPMYWSFPSRHAEGYKNELNHFIDVVQGQENLSVSGKMTLAVSKIATACETSARSGKPVELTWDASEIPDEYKFA